MNRRNLRGRRAGEDAIPLNPARTSAPGRRDVLQLIAALDSGESWSDAYARFWSAQGEPPVRDWPPTDGRVNWIWLTDLEKLDRAIDLASPLGELSGDLAREFSVVEYVSAPSGSGAIAQRRFGDRVQMTTSRSADVQPTPGSADCVVFAASRGWQLRIPQWIDGLGGIPAAAFQWLRPGGWFVCLLPNTARMPLRPSSLHRLHVDRRAVKTVERSAVRSGFGQVRQYMAAHGMHLPLGIIPDDPVAIRASLQWGGESTRWKVLLKGLAPRLSFPGSIIMARK